MQRAVITINDQGIIRSVNHVALHFFGYKDPKSLIGKPLTMLIPPPYKEQHDGYMKKYMETRQAKIIGRSRVVEGLHSDGTIFSMRLAVSELKVGEEVLYCGLIEKLEDLSCLITINIDGEILTCCKRMEDMLGWKPQELIGQNISMLCDSTHAPKHNNYIKAYLNGGKAKAIDKVRNVKAKRKDGKEVVISLEVTERNEGDHTIFVGKINEITEEMEAIVNIDKKGIIIEMNSNLWTLFGYNQEELLGKNIKILMAHPHSELHDAYLKRYLRTGEKRIIDKPPRILKAKHKDGSTFFIYLQVNEYKNNNGELCFSGKITRVLKPTNKKNKQMNKKSFKKMSKKKVEEQENDDDDDDNDNNDNDNDDEIEIEEGQNQEDHKYIGNYIIQKTIAEGLYGKVKLAIHQLTKEKVIIKIIEKNKIEAQRFREIELMKKLFHQNVVRMLEVVESYEKLYIIYEFIEGGELYEYMMDKGNLTENEARIFWREIVSAVDYMHYNNIAHRDLKLENIMLDSNKNVVIIDLGLGNFMQDGKLLNTFCGSTAYAPPEMFLAQRYTGSSADVWSMGVILFCLVCGFLPFEDPQHIIRADFIPLNDPDDEDPVIVSPEFEDLISKIFQIDPRQRITIEGIRNHPWTNKDLPAMEPYTNNNSSSSSSSSSISTSLNSSSDAIKKIHDKDLMRKLQEFGFDADSVLRSITEKEFNPITAALYLLQKQQEKEENNIKNHRPRVTIPLLDTDRKRNKEK